MQPTIEERLADEADLSLDQLSHWAGIPCKRVRAWADGDIEPTEEEQVRLRAVITLYLNLYEQLTWLGEVFEERFGPAKQTWTRPH